LSVSVNSKGEIKPKMNLKSKKINFSKKERINTISSKKKRIIEQCSNMADLIVLPSPKKKSINGTKK